MLVRSPKGELSAAMRRIQNRYVRYFNRGRRRDGSLVRGRFLSRPVDSFTYRRILVRYIDATPVGAGLCADPRDYPWGSARQYAARRSPRWLTRTWVEAWVSDLAGAAHYDPSMYSLAIGDLAWEKVSNLVESRLVQSSRAPDELDSLLQMAPPQVLEWLRRKTKLADQTRLGLAHVAAEEVHVRLVALRANQGAWAIRPSRTRQDGWTILEAGLLRDLACTSLAEIGHRIRASQAKAFRLHKLHRRMMCEDDEYARVAARTAREILRGSVPAELVGRSFQANSK
jgi:hypothetical protein